MAHIQVVQTGTRVQTHIRGRVYRMDRTQLIPTRPKLKSKDTGRRMVCLLSVRAAAALENWGISHPCSAGGHPHFTRSQIEGMVTAGDLRWVGAGQNVAAYRAPRFLAIRQSGPVTCVQLVTS